MDKKFTATMKNDLKELNYLISNLNHFLKTHHILGKRLYDVNLAIEEPLVNIINHGSEDNIPVSIDIEVEIKMDEISVQIIDDGKRFNPLGVPHLDLRKPALERPPGGLGMHLVRSIMQAMWYERKEGKNFFQIQIER